MIGKTVLVTGGAGFIGTNLTARLLQEGASVIIVDNLQTGRMANLARFDKKLPLKFVRADISDPLPALGHVDEIYNLACAASPPHYQVDPVHTMMTSVTGTLQLLRLAEATSARLVMASTSEVYGDPKEHPQHESYLGNVSTTGPRACYDEGKRAAETLCSDFQRRGVDVRIARIFNTYGPFMRSDDGRVVSNVICQALTDQDITIYGEGHQTRSFCFVDDLVDGLMRLIRVEAAPDGPVNLGNPEEFTIREMVDVVLERIETRSTIVHRPLPQDDPQRRCPDIGRARELLGWEPRIPFRVGLLQTIDWFSTALEDGAEATAQRAAVA